MNNQARYHLHEKEVNKILLGVDRTTEVQHIYQHKDKRSAKTIHLEALTEVFELILIASVIALVADTAWMLHDIIHNGLSVTYAGILSGLVTATCITSWAWIKHHNNNYARLTKELLKNKLQKQKHINRHKREHGGE